MIDKADPVCFTKSEESAKMELRQMIYFKELSECLNLPAAARALYITPQALSKSMRVLAREFDTEIFYRDQGKLRLTTFGQALLSEVTVLLSQINAMEDRRKTSPARKIIISASPAAMVFSRVISIPSSPRSKPNIQR